MKAFIEERGITTLFPPQQKAIQAGALEGKHLVLAIPTASGKTLVAELCMLKAILERGLKAIYLTPLRALASEKYDDFLHFEKFGVKVGITTGDYDSADEKLGVYDLLVCTNERADSLLRHQASWLSKVGIVVADEVHLINDLGRGPTLEVVLVRLKQVAPKAQILALSATVGNAEELAAWLQGVAVTSEWRPVTLREGVYHEGRVRFVEGDEERYTPASSFPIGDITRQVLRDQGQLLIFLNTRKSAMNTAQRLGPIISRILSKQDRIELDEISRRVLQSGEVTQVTDRLAKLVSAGVAFHHAGLRHAERKLVEDAFRQALIKAVCATPTLSAGINMPARFVVINEYRRFDRTEGYQPIPVLEYKQMAGRAGRPKYDKTGTSVLIARRQEEVAFLMDNYVLGEAENVISKLASESALRSHILSTIALGYASSKEDIMEFISQTFFGHQRDPKEVTYMVDLIVRFLKDEDLLRRRGNELIASSFGRRVSQLYIDPKSAVIMRDGLLTASKAATEVTPFSYLHLICHTPDQFSMYLRRGEEERTHDYVSEHIEEFLVPVPSPRYNRTNYEFFLAEVKSALLTNGWIEEISEEQLTSQFNIGSGDLRRLVDTQVWLLYACRELAQVFKRKSILTDLEQLELRVRYGVRRELAELVQLKGIGRVRGRLLFRNGFVSKERIRDAPLAKLAAVPTIGSEIARSIKTQCGGVIAPAEEQSLKESSSSTTRQARLSLE